VSQPFPEVVLSAQEEEINRHKRLSGIARNSAAMLAGQVIIKILSFVFSVFVVRRLGASDFGIYTSIMAFAFIFAMLTDLGTSTLSTREMARIEANVAWMIPDTMTIRAILSLLVIIGNTLAAWLLGRPVEIIIGTFIASIGLLLYAIHGPLDSLLIAKERLYYSSLFNVFNQVTFVILGTIALLSGKGYLGLLTASLMGVFVMGTASATIVLKQLKIRFVRPAPSRWKNLLKASLPFGVIGVIVEFSARFDTVFMSFILPFAVVGYYNVSNNLILTTMLMAQSLALSMFPAMVKEYNSGQGSIIHTVQRAMRYLLMISLPVSVGGTLIAHRLILILYGKEFEQAITVFRIMIWALPFMFLAEVLGRTSIVMNLERKVAAFIAVNACISIGMSLTLIPAFGAIGAAIALVINRFNNVLLSIIILKPKLLFEGNVLPLIRVVIASLVMGIVVMVLGRYSILSNQYSIFSLLLLVLAGAVIYLISIFSFKAVTTGEARFVFNIIRRRN
jgi:O-antigen/teichoic acid export membrane protein